MATQEEIQPAIDRILEDRTNAIWAYVREHAHSLNSDVACRWIRAACERGAEEIGSVLAEVAGRLDAATKRKQEISVELKAAHKQNADLQAQLLTVQSTAAQLQASLDECQQAGMILQKKLDALQKPKRKRDASDVSASESVATPDLLPQGISDEPRNPVGASPAAAC